MSSASPPFADLGAAIAAEEFPDVDLALRRGRHIDRSDEAWYAYISDAQPHLEHFYRRLGCELVHKSDGYYYLLPLTERVPRRHLAVGDMLVGQALTLLFLDPSAVQRGGIVDRSEILAQLDGIVGTDALIRAFNPKRRRYDERVAQQTVRKKVGEVIRRLARLGFVDQLDDERIELRASLLRFADPVRELGEPAEALARLMARGEVALAEQDDTTGSEASTLRDDVHGSDDSDDESGDDESGDDESGDDESGDDESGDDESGDDESGDDESGDDELADGDTAGAGAAVEASDAHVAADLNRQLELDPRADGDEVAANAVASREGEAPGRGSEG